MTFYTKFVRSFSEVLLLLYRITKKKCEIGVGRHWRSITSTCKRSVRKAHCPCAFWPLKAVYSPHRCKWKYPGRSAVTARWRRRGNAHNMHKSIIEAQWVSIHYNREGVTCYSVELAKAQHVLAVSKNIRKNRPTSSDLKKKNASSQSAEYVVGCYELKN